MQRLLRSPYAGLVITGITASLALLIEHRLPVSSEIHFFLQFVWVGVVGAALMAFALMPTQSGNSAASSARLDAASQSTITEEFLDEDRVWLQTHPDSSWNEQV